MQDVLGRRSGLKMLNKNCTGGFKCAARGGVGNQNQLNQQFRLNLNVAPEDGHAEGFWLASVHRVRYQARTHGTH